MADFAPFHGLRYNAEKVELSKVLAPPYDVIKGAMRDELLQSSPYNIVEVELPQSGHAEGDDDSKYAQAARVLQQWREEGILKLDDAAFYVYEQEFKIPSGDQVLKRRGVLGALQLEEFGKGVQPHEHTLSGPKEDRLKLLSAARANTSPIFGLHADENGWVAGLLKNYCTSAKPAMEARDGDGILHRLWVLSDDETVNAIVGALDDEAILIADGHHRYETALNYRNECAQKVGAKWTGAEPENFVLMMCVSMQDEGLIVLPTHRLVKNADAQKLESLPQLLQKYFDVEPINGGASTLLQKTHDGDDLKIGLVLPDAQYLLKLKNAHGEAMDNSKSAAFNQLDVTVLHRLILQNELGIDAEKLAAGNHVGYTICAEDAARKVQSGEYSAAFVLRPTRVEQVKSCCNAGDKMPQKSTYFYPKLITGLVLRPLDF